LKAEIDTLGTADPSASKIRPDTVD